MRKGPQLARLDIAETGEHIPASWEAKVLGERVIRPPETEQRMPRSAKFGRQRNEPGPF